MCLETRAIRQDNISKVIYRSLWVHPMEENALVENVTDLVPGATRKMVIRQLRTMARNEQVSVFAATRQGSRKVGPGLKFTLYIHGDHKQALTQAKPRRKAAVLTTR